MPLLCDYMHPTFGQRSFRPCPVPASLCVHGKTKTTRCAGGRTKGVTSPKSGPSVLRARGLHARSHVSCVGWTVLLDRRGMRGALRVAARGCMLVLTAGMRRRQERTTTRAQLPRSAWSTRRVVASRCALLRLAGMSGARVRQLTRRVALRFSRRGADGATAAEHLRQSASHARERCCAACRPPLLCSTGVAAAAAPAARFPRPPLGSECGCRSHAVPASPRSQRSRW